MIIYYYRVRNKLKEDDNMDFDNDTIGYEE